MKKNKIKYWFFVLTILILILILSSIISLSVGSARIPFKEITDIIVNGKGTTSYEILFNIRLPRLILGLVIGGALSLAGTIFQGIFHNPLVEPYTLGISGGASLGICLNIIFKWNEYIGLLAFPLSSSLGALLTIFFVYNFSIKAGNLNTNNMLLIGVMISFVSSSIVMLLMAISKTNDLYSIVFWIMGSLDESNLSLIKIVSIGILTGLICSYFFCFDMNALILGEEEAIHLGVKIKKTKKYLFLIASILTGLSVSVGGIIMFVGLIVPHFIRMTVGTDHRILLIGSFLAGASLLTLCDVIARTVISPLELPVGVITGIVGGVLFIYVLIIKKVVI